MILIYILIWFKPSQQLCRILWENRQKPSIHGTLRPIRWWHYEHRRGVGMAQQTVIQPNRFAQLLVSFQNILKNSRQKNHSGSASCFWASPLCRGTESYPWGKWHGDAQKIVQQNDMKWPWIDSIDETASVPSTWSLRIIPILLNNHKASNDFFFAVPMRFLRPVALSCLCCTFWHIDMDKCGHPVNGEESWVLLTGETWNFNGLYLQEIKQVIKL